MTYDLCLLKCIATYLIIYLSLKVAYAQNVTTNNAHNLTAKHSEILSRKKRFLIFPEGSSLQIVFCLTYPTIFAVGDIFLLGNTVALAWELPQDPYSPYMHHADPLHRRVDTKTLYFTDDIGRVLFKRPYKRKPILNPAFAKRSTDELSKSEAGRVDTDEFKKVFDSESKVDYRLLHEAQSKRDFLKSESMDETNVHFHRSSRTGLYGKIEAMFRALGTDGRQCMLKTLCKTGQTHDSPQGSFLEELLRAVFTLPKGREFQADYHKAYDVAHLASSSCDLLYPGCDNLVLDPTASRFNY